MHKTIHGPTLDDVKFARFLLPSFGTLVVLSVVCTLAACSVEATNTSKPSAPVSVPSTSSTTSRHTDSPPVTSVVTHAVKNTSFDVVEPGSPSRILPTTVWFPATDRGEGPLPDLAGAPYPLLVFSQGYDLSVSAYGALLEDWASAGFVVAAPTYPHTDPSDLAALDESDIVNHPNDLRFVITTLLDTAHRSGNVLSGLINSNEIGLIGHSDGGDVSLAVAENSCCRDTRVRAAAILSGAELAAFGGTYSGVGSVPLMVTQGSADTINVPACSVQIYNGAPPPKYYLDLLGSGHETPYVSPGVAKEVVARVVADFFESELAGRRSSATTMTRDGNVANIAQITSASTAPSGPGICPGAPG